MRVPSTRFIFLFVFIPFISLSLHAQAPVQEDQIRIQLWADLDPFPGVFSDDDSDDADFSDADIVADGFADSAAGSASVGSEGALGEAKVPEKIRIFSYAINRTREIAPFLMSGMLSGWSFEYTPSDKARRVEEYWSFSEIQPFNPSVNHISFHAPRTMEDRLVCWAYCDRTPMQKLEYERWSSIRHPHVRGIGRGSVEDGFEGIKAACGEALKNAVREYWRTMIKNKPKEITGNALVIKNPRIYIKDGNYVVDLDFFLETDRIVEYKMF